MTDFDSFGLRPELLRALKERGFFKPSSIQADGLPEALAGNDLLCQSKTGSGKTAVFVLSSLNRMDFSEHIETVVLVPTRELAVQTVNEYNLFGKYIRNSRPVSFFGGLPKEVDVASIRSSCPNVVVATPGRLMYLLENNYVSARHVRHFILDECDLLLRDTAQMANDVRYILSRCPEERQIQMYTATITASEAERERLFLRLMHCPKFILVRKQYELTVKSLLQYRVSVDDECKKTRALIYLLEEIEFNQVAIFVNTVERCCALCNVLEEKNFSALPLHSSMSQRERLENFGKFKDFRRRILVATDLMGRGIDAEFVTFVINYDVPLNENTYLHRVGRTGRMERRALAVTICVAGQDEELLRNIQCSFGINLAELPQNLNPDVYLDFDF